MRQHIEITAAPGLGLDEATALLQTLNALGRELAPTFGVGLTVIQRADTEAGPPFGQIDLTVACFPPPAMPAAVERIGRAVLELLTRRGGAGRVRLGGAEISVEPGAKREEIPALVGRLMAGAAAALDPSTPLAADWPDPSRDAASFRQFVRALSGLAVEGIVEFETADNAEVYRALCPGGYVLLAPEQGGWALAFVPTGGENPTHLWQTVPPPGALVTSLNLDTYLDSPSLGDAVEFHHIEGVPGEGVERKHYTTAVGRVVVHTRRKPPDAPLEMVIELRDEGRILLLDAGERFVGTGGQLGRRQLQELPF